MFLQYPACGLAIRNSIIINCLYVIKWFLLLFLFCRTVFAPLWLFHAVVARGRFSLPAPSLPHDRRV